MSAGRRVVAQQVARAAAAAGLTASRKVSQPITGMVSAAQAPQEVTVRATVTGEQWANHLEMVFHKWLEDRNSVATDCDVFFVKLLKRFPIAAAARETLSKRESKKVVEKKKQEMQVKLKNSLIRGVEKN